MAFDNSRFIFDPWKNYSGVVMEQGRVQLDSDWNEWHAEIARRIQAGTLDIMGHAAYPATTPAAFQITASSSPSTVLIGCGRMYVDGLLAENHGLPANARWDPALAELSGSPQPPPQPPPPPSSSNTIDFAHQPYLPGASVPTDIASYLFYLDVWTRPVTFLEDANLIDKAVGVDTTGRLQTVWQVGYMPAGTYTCATPDSQIAYPAASTGLLSTNVVPNPSAGPCCLTTGTGYTGVENQFYRVEIHQGGPGSDTPGPGTATFKWSRDNASVATGVTAITSGADTAGNPASVLTVMSLGRDQVLGFSPGDWIEILDDWTELWGIAGILCQIDSVSVSAKTITLTSTVPTTPTTAGATPPSFPVTTGTGLTDPHRHTRIIRWDQSGTVYKLNGTQLEPWAISAQPAARSLSRLPTPRWFSRTALPSSSARVPPAAPSMLAISGALPRAPPTAWSRNSSKRHPAAFTTLYEAFDRHLRFSCQLSRLPHAVDLLGSGRLRLLHLHGRRRGRELRQVFFYQSGDPIAARDRWRGLHPSRPLLRVRRHQWPQGHRHTRLRPANAPRLTVHATGQYPSSWQKRSHHQQRPCRHHHCRQLEPCRAALPRRGSRR